MRNSAEPYRQRTTLKTLLAALVALLAGVCLVSLAVYWQTESAHPLLRTLALNFGSLLIATIALGTLWELFAKRSLLSELLAEARRAEAIQQSGIIDVSDSWYVDIPWQKLFRSVHHLDIFFAYGSTWRGSFAEELRLLAKRGRNRVRVVLPDPENELIVRTLAVRFGGREPADIKKRIEEARADFEDMFTKDPHDDFEYSIWYLPKDPVFSFYRFDDTAILSLYKHRDGRGGVPTVILERGGSLFEFVYEEFEAFVSGASPLARCVAASGGKVTTAKLGG